LVNTNLFIHMRGFCFLIWFTLVWASSLYAQVDTTQFRQPENYRLAANYYLQESNIDPSSEYYAYQAACYLSLSDAADSALIYINRTVENGAKAEDIITDTDFNRLHSIAQWNTLMAMLKERYLKENPGITHPEQGVALWLLGIEDQRFRTLLKNDKLRSNQQGLIDDGDKRLKAVEGIVHLYGWPSIAKVGEKASEAAFLIVQHAKPSDIKRNLPLVVAAAHRGEIKRKWAALMIDRYLVMVDGVQIYGTQFGRSGKKNKDSGIIEWTPLMLNPVVEEESLAERRKGVGLDPVELDAVRLHITYVSPSQREGYTPIRMKQKYVKRGYLF